MSTIKAHASKYLTAKSAVVPAEQLVGYYITPIKSFALWAFISLAAGFGISQSLFLLDVILALLTGSGLMGWGWWLLAGLVLSAYIAMPEEKVTVPDNHVAIITFFGRRYPVFLAEGEYPWIGRRFFIDINRNPIPNAKNVTKGDGEEQGFVYIGNRILQIWNSRQEKKSTMYLATKSGSTVSTSLTTRIATIDPLKWASSDDAVLTVAEQARAGIRKAFSYFRDTDIAGAKSAVVELLRGNAVLACFMSKRSGSYLQYTMLQTEGGVPLYQTVSGTQNEGGNVQETMQQKLAAQTLWTTIANEDMLKACKNRSGELEVTKIEIDEKLTTAVQAVGAVIIEVIVTEVQLSDAVRKAAEAAASEGQQREAQITSADTQVEVMQKLAAARTQGGVTELDQVLAAAADGNESVRIVHISGQSGNRRGRSQDADITRAAAVINATNQQRGNNT